MTLTEAYKAAAVSSGHQSFMTPGRLPLILWLILLMHLRSLYTHLSPRNPNLHQPTVPARLFAKLLPDHPSSQLTVLGIHTAARQLLWRFLLHDVSDWWNPGVDSDCAMVLEMYVEAAHWQIRKSRPGTSRPQDGVRSDRPLRQDRYCLERSGSSAILQ